MILKRIKLFFCFFIIFLLTSSAFPRAGGAGGGHSSGGGRSGGSFGGSSFSHSSSTGRYAYRNYNDNNTDSPVMVLLLLFFLFIIIMLFFKRISSVQRNTNLSSSTETNLDLIEEKLKKYNIISKDDYIDLVQKAKKAFFIIQDCWSRQEIKPMRRFISDGIYQRFNVQFLMMHKLQQKNTMSDVRISQVQLLSMRTEADYIVVDLQLFASAFDQFISPQIPELNSPGGLENFSEVWTFIKKIDSKKGDIFNTEHCPSCAAPLNLKLEATARCPYCSAYINNAEYDWVLSEITQVEEIDFAHATMLQSSQHPLLDPQLVKEAQKIEPHFSKQIMEDQASNFFIQIILGCALNQPSRLQRFCTSEVIHQIPDEFKFQNLVFNRFYISDATTTGLQVTDNELITHTVITAHYQPVLINESSIEKLEPDISTFEYLIKLNKKVSNSAKGSILTNSCSSCGATQKDHLSTTCEFCGKNLFNPEQDWICTGLQLLT